MGLGSMAGGMAAGMDMMDRAERKRKIDALILGDKKQGNQGQSTDPVVGKIEQPTVEVKQLDSQPNVQQELADGGMVGCVNDRVIPGVTLSARSFGKR